jgi:hypothetical protein
MSGSGGGCPFAPRCPLKADICESEEPELRLVAVGGDGQGTTAGNGSPRPTPATDTEHLAACHFADAVVGMPIASMFPDTSDDQEGVAP